MIHLQILHSSQADLDKLPPLTVLPQKERVTDEISDWVMTCCELGIVDRAGTTEVAKEALTSEITDFLTSASESEVQERLSQGL